MTSATKEGFSSIASRLAWELYVGPIPNGLNVLHKCDWPPCTRTSHLFLGTHADNNADMWQKGRGLTGTRLGKLTVEQVIEIRKRYIPRVVTAKMLAEEFDVTPSNITAIIRKQTWRHLL